MMLIYFIGALCILGPLAYLAWHIFYLERGHKDKQAIVLLTLSKESKMTNIALALNDDQQAQGTFVVNDAKGNPDPTASISWTVDNPAIATISVSNGGQSLLVTAQTPGVANLTGTSGSLSLGVVVTVTASADTQITGSFSAPTTQAPSTPPAPPPASGS
jgi:hypothetical protein